MLLKTRRKTNERSSRRGLFFSTSIAQNNNAAKTGRKKINKSSQFSESRQQEGAQCEQGKQLARSYSEGAAKEQLKEANANRVNN